MMKARERPLPVRFVIPPLDAMAPSGVRTFVEQMLAGFGPYGDWFSVVEIPHGEASTAGEPPGPAAFPRPPPGAARATGDESATEARRVRPALLLALGYAKSLFRDVRRVWAVRAELSGGVIVTNQFGCETLPIALRIVCPLARLVAVSHTHPGQGAAAAAGVRRAVERWCYRSLSDIVFNSDASRQLWRAKLGLKRIKGEVVHLGLGEPERDIPADYPPRPAGTVDFVCLGRFVAWKGQMNLVRAWRVLLDRGVRHARLVLVGDGECLAAVKREAEALELGNHVVFLGLRPRGACYLNAADVAVLASVEPEAFGLVLLEAMSRGKPVMASRIGGVTEIVRDGETGLLFDPSSPAALADAAGRLAGSSAERQRLGEGGRCRWESEFTTRRMVSDYLRYFGIPERQPEPRSTSA